MPLLFVVQTGDVAPLLQLLVDVLGGSRVGEPGLASLLLGRLCEHPRLGRLQLLDVAAVVSEHGAGRLDVAAPGQLQREVDAVALALLLQRGNLRTKAVCCFSVLGGVCDLRLQLLDPGIALGQLLLIRFRVNAASCSGVNARFLGVLALRFLLALLLLRRLAFLLLDLLRVPSRSLRTFRQPN